MKITLDIPDDLLEPLIRESDVRQKSHAGVLLEQIRRGQAVPFASRVLLLLPEDLTGLEEILGHGHILTSNDLIAKVNRLANVTFGEHRIHLTQAQLEELAWRAKKQGKSIEQVLEQAWKRIQDQLFTQALAPVK